MNSHRDPLFGGVTYVCRYGHHHTVKARAAECEQRIDAKASAQRLFAPAPWTFDAMAEDAIARRGT